MGARLSRHIRALRRELPVLFASGYRDRSRFLDELQEGARLLAIPFRIDTLLNRVKQALERTG